MGRRIMQGLHDSNMPATLISKDNFPNVFLETNPKSVGITSGQLFSEETIFILYTIKELLLSMLLVPSTLKAIKKARKNNLIPVILAFDDTFSSLPAYIVSSLTDSPYIIQIHALYKNYLACFIKNSTVQKILLKIQMFTINNSDMILNINSETMNYFSSHSTLPPSENKLLFTPIDTLLFSPNSEYRTEIRNEFGIDDKANVIGFVGRLFSEKNIPLLLQAYSEALKTSLFPATTVILIVGDGPLKSILIELSAKLSINNKVIFTGFRNDVHKIMNAIDILVLPSQVEGLSCAILEAMSCGVPVICSNLPSNIELLEKAECGFTFDVENVQELTNRLSILIKDPSLRKRLGVNGRCYVEKRHTLNSVITDYNKAMLTSIKTRYG